MTDSSQLPPPDQPEESNSDAAASDRRTVIVGRTTPQSKELRVSADEAVNPFPGPWKVKALVQDREADSLPQLHANPPELSVVQGEQDLDPEAQTPEAEPDTDDGASSGDNPQLRLL